MIICVSHPPPPPSLPPVPGGVILFSSGFADAAEHRAFNNKILIDSEYICFSKRVEAMKTGKGVFITSFRTWQIFTGNGYARRNTEGFEGVKSSEARFMTWRHPQFG